MYIVLQTFFIFSQKIFGASDMQAKKSPALNVPETYRGKVKLNAKNQSVYSAATFKSDVLPVFTSNLLSRSLFSTIT